jgi:hypothetical protein
MREAGVNCVARKGRQHVSLHPKQPVLAATETRLHLVYEIWSVIKTGHQHIIYQRRPRNFDAARTLQLYSKFSSSSILIESVLWQLELRWEYKVNEVIAIAGIWGRMWRK